MHKRTEDDYLKTLEKIKKQYHQHVKDKQVSDPSNHMVYNGDLPKSN